MPTNIPPQALGPALTTFAQIRGMQVLYLSETVRGRRTAGTVGELTADEALARLLQGTGLTYRYVSENAVTIVREQPAAATTGTVKPVAADPARSPAPAAGSKQDLGAAFEQPVLEEMIVTASKRPVALRKMANSVSAFGDQQLGQLGAQSFQDYIGRAPGVIFHASTPGVGNVTIRGIGTATVYPDQGQATTGIYLNDIPLTDPGFAVSVPDLDIFDVQRVEVLRGPQGTLFGSATLGGAVNYILNPVSLTAHEAIAQVAGSTTASSADMGYAAKAAVNLPLASDVFGIRLTGIKRFEPGYLANVGLGRRNTNSRDVAAGRINTLWKINPRLTLDFFSFHERARNGDGFYALPALRHDFGELARDTLVPEGVIFTTRINSLKLDTDLGFATLTASAADSRKAQDFHADNTAFYGIPTISEGRARTRSRMGELRLISPGNQRFDWLVGAYHGGFDEYYPSPVIRNGVTASQFTVSYRSDEYALFGEATYRFDEHWRTTVGGRYYDTGVKTRVLQGPPDNPRDNAGRQRQSGFIPKVSLTYEPDPMLMAYGLVSKGFRMGGVNLVAPMPDFPTPGTYGSDQLTNYELGLRLTSSDRALAFDTSFFFIDWTNIQLRLERPDEFSYVKNAGSAHSRGVEASLSWRLPGGLSLLANVTYLDAALAESLDLGNSNTLLDGTALPGASRWSTSATIGYEFTGVLRPRIAMSHRYLSSADSSFQRSQPVGNYSIVDLRCGIDVGRLGVTAFANNIADRRGVTAAAMYGTNITEFYVMPRTVGLQFDWRL